MTDLGKNIRKIRAFKKISQAKFAQIFGLTRASIGAYEEGRAKPKMETSIKIANYFSIPVEYFLTKEITVNQLSGIESYSTGHVPVDIGTAFTGYQASYKLRYVDSSALNDYAVQCNKAGFHQQLPVISLPFSPQKAERAFMYHPGFIKTDKQHYQPGDVLFCKRQLLTRVNSAASLLIILNDGVYLSCMQYSTERKWLINPENSLQKIIKDEIIELWEVVGILSFRVREMDSISSQLTTLEKAAKKIDKYLGK